MRRGGSCGRSCCAGGVRSGATARRAAPPPSSTAPAGGPSPRSVHPSSAATAATRAGTVLVTATRVTPAGSRPARRHASATRARTPAIRPPSTARSSSESMPPVYRVHRERGNRRGGRGASLRQLEVPTGLRLGDFHRHLARILGPVVLRDEPGRGLLLRAILCPVGADDDEVEAARDALPPSAVLRANVPSGRSWAEPSFPNTPPSFAFGVRRISAPPRTGSPFGPRTAPGHRVGGTGVRVRVAPGTPDERREGEEGNTQERRPHRNLQTWRKGRGRGSPPAPSAAMRPISRC